jgi:flavin-dependent dehydrogenase
VVRAIDLPRKLERFYQRFYINIHREKFDRWLVSLLPESVDVRAGALFRTFTEVGGKYRIDFMELGEKKVEEARVLIGADGAFSMVRRLLGAAPPPSEIYFSSQECVETESVLPYFTAVFDRSVTDFYSWMIPKEDRLLVGTAVLAGKSAASRLQVLKDKLARRGFRFGKVVRKNGAYILRPRGRKIVHLGEGRVGLVGEAAGWISPSSAEGLSYAFRSAKALADALLQKNESFLGAYISKSARLRLNVLGKAVKASILYHPLSRGLIMRTGLGSMKVAAHAPPTEPNPAE